MVYKNKFVAAIKVAGQTLPEKRETVVVPFSSEYSIFLKNLETKRCKVEIEIDGSNVTGSGLVIEPSSSIDLERFIDSDRKFKYIAKNKEIQEFLGHNPEDSLIVIKYAFEKNQLLNTSNNHYHYHTPYWYDRPQYPNSPHWPGQITFGCDSISSVSNSHRSSISSNSVVKSMGQSTPVNLNNVEVETGITVEGSQSDQVFNTTSDFQTDHTETIIFKLAGNSDELVTIKSKKQCPSCGKKYKASTEYCKNDGTYLRN